MTLYTESASDSDSKKSKRSFAPGVKSWRNATKLRIIEAMGGKCCICGYNKSFRSLVLHHLDPDEKEFSFAGARANPKSWPKLVEEIRKCVLLCANCHGEVHDGITVVPKNAINFDEKWADYTAYKKFWDKCPVCGNDKPKSNQTCSLSCAALKSRKVDWDNINLIKLLEHMSMNAIAKSLNISEAAVRKRRKKLGI